MKDSCFALAYRKRRNSTIMLLALCAVMCAVGYTPPLRAQSPKTLSIAAAADLQPVMPTLAAAYESATGIKIVSSFGSSATLTQQLLNGDPQDVFLSADFAHPEELIAAKVATGLGGAQAPTRGAQAPTPYARGVLVLWARKDSPAQPLTLDSLLKPTVTQVSIANGMHAPYGFAATKALESLHMTSAVSKKLVVAENIGQAAQFAESGNAQAGLISLTIASSPHFRELGTFVRIPPEAYPPIRQCAVVLDASKHHAEAESFLRWLTSEQTQKKLSGFGLEPAS